MYEHPVDAKLVWSLFAVLLSAKWHNYAGAWNCVAVRILRRRPKAGVSIISERMCMFDLLFAPCWHARCNTAYLQVKVERLFRVRHQRHAGWVVWVPRLEAVETFFIPQNTLSTLVLYSGGTIMLMLWSQIAISINGDILANVYILICFRLSVLDLGYEPHVRLRHHNNSVSRS